MKLHYFNIKKWKPNFCRNFNFTCIWAERGPKQGILYFLRTNFLFIFYKAVWNENYCDTWLPIPIIMSGKILGLEFVSKMLLTDQIVKDSWKSNVSRISRAINFLKVSHKSTGLGSIWLGMFRLIQNYILKIYSKDRYGQVSFCILYCLLIFDCFGWSF